MPLLLKRLLKKITPPFLFFFLPLPAFAIVGQYESSAIYPQQSCQILKSSEEEPEKRNHCSGTLVGSTQILTAAHCIEGHEEEYLWIKCPGEKIQKVANRKINPAFTGKQNIRAKTSKSDMGILSVSTPFKAEPAKLVYSTKQAEELFIQGKCYGFGYGIDSTGRAGNHRGAKLQLMTEQTRMTKLHKDFKYSMVTDGRNELRPGDSGGGLYCKNKHGDWVLMGVNSMILAKEALLNSATSSHEYFSVVSLLNENFAWIDNELDLSKSSLFPVKNYYQLLCQTQDCIKNYGPYSFGDHTQGVLQILKKLNARYDEQTRIRRKNALYEQNQALAVQTGHAIDKLTLELYEIAKSCGKIPDGHPLPSNLQKMSAE